MPLKLDEAGFQSNEIVNLFEKTSKYFCIQDVVLGLTNFRQFCGKSWEQKDLIKSLSKIKKLVGS